MLIKFGNSIVINVIKIIDYAVVEKVEKEVLTPGTWLKPAVTQNKTIYGVELNYYNIDNHKAKYTVMCRDDLEVALKIHREITQQAKELELENMTATLEDAIRSN